jgi:hypothetical protein
VSWPAIVAGAVVACALTLVLLAFGTGLGLSMVSPWARSGVSATTFKIGTGLYLIVIAMIASSLGGYLAGRLRSSWTGVRSDEVYFRDTAHGFVAWALASVLGAAVLASPASSLIGGTAAGATQGAVSSAQSSGPMDGYVDTLLRTYAIRVASVDDQPALMAAVASEFPESDPLVRFGVEAGPGRHRVSRYGRGAGVAGVGRACGGAAGWPVSVWPRARRPARSS